MKVLLSLLFGLLLSFSGAGVAKETHRYEQPDHQPPIYLTITDEACPPDVVAVAVALGATADMVKTLTYAHGTLGTEHVRLCVFPPDSDGDWALVDSEGRLGWLLGKHAKELF